MIFSENRHPLFGIMLWQIWLLGGDRQGCMVAGDLI